MKRLIIKGIFWTAGDEIYVEYWNNQGWENISLNELLKRNVKENSNVTITVEVEENGNEALD